MRESKAQQKGRGAVIESHAALCLCALHFLCEMHIQAKF